MSIPTRGLNHITVRVCDLERSVAFYEQVLGFRVRHRGEHDAYLESGTLWLALVESEVERGTGGGSVDHLALTVAEEDFDAAVDTLRTCGVTIIKGPIIRGVGKSVYFLDSDGLLLELHTSNLDERMTEWT